MILKYGLLLLVGYLVYRGLQPVKRVEQPQDQSSDDFADYEEID